jgi:outer membrane protein TolC
MCLRSNSSDLRRECGYHLAAVLALSLLCSGVAAAQSAPSITSKPEPLIPTAIGLRIDLPEAGRGLALTEFPGDAPAGVRRITLQQAQDLAAQAINPLVRLGELQVEAAEQHRLGTRALYFPNVSGQLENLHFNKLPGEVLTAQRPIEGSTLSVPVNIISQDQTAVNVSVVQPLTPIFAVRQLVKIAKADENIARAKAGMPVAELASLVETTYFDLLVAERELVGAGAETKKVQAKWLTASHSGVTAISTEQKADAIGAARSWLVAVSTVKRLSASLDEILGLPADTRLELVTPEPLVEHVSLKDATAAAASASTDVIEAEQTAVKARAASTLSKMEYFPSIALVGGYTPHQSAINVVLPESFSYVGLIATYTLFDSGKRERSVKERSAQVEMAELGVQLNKAKAMAAVKTSYFELERSRELAQLARGMVSAPQVVDASNLSDDEGVDPARAHMEAELLRAELDYRQAYSRLKNLMGHQ